MAEPHAEILDLLTAAIQKAVEAKYAREDVLRAVTDWAVSIGLIMGGEETVAEMIERMHQRVAEWKAGEFPAMAPPRTKLY
jgi:hypothetical protein